MVDVTTFKINKRVVLVAIVAVPTTVVEASPAVSVAVWPTPSFLIQTGLEKDPSTGMVLPRAAIIDAVEGKVRV